MFKDLLYSARKKLLCGRFSRYLARYGITRYSTVVDLSEVPSQFADCCVSYSGRSLRPDNNQMAAPAPLPHSMPASALHLRLPDLRGSACVSQMEPPSSPLAGHGEGTLDDPTMTLTGMCDLSHVVMCFCHRLRLPSMIFKLNCMLSF